MSTLKRFATQSATTLTTGYETTPPDGKVWNVPRLYVCNTDGSEAVVSVSLKSGSTETFLVKDYTLEGNDTLVLENIVLLPGDNLVVDAGGPYTIHVYGSIIEEDS